MNVGVSTCSANVDVSRRSTLRTDALLLVFVLTLAAFPYLNTLHNLFVYDDSFQVVNNPYLQNFHHLKEIFTTPVWSFLGGDYPHNYYRPMMLFGYLLCRQFLGPIPLAFVAAGLFAVHPIHSESVAWIAAITDIELALFYLLTFWFFLGLSKVHGRRLILGELSMVVSFALALLAKEPAATLVVLATLYEHCCREDRKETSVRIKLSRYGPLWLVLLVYLIVRTHFVG